MHMCVEYSRKCLHYADLRSRFAHVMNRRDAEASTPNAQAPGREVSVERHTRVTGDMVFRDVLRAGGLFGLTPKEMFR